MIKYLLFRVNMFFILNEINKQRKEKSYKGDIRLKLSLFNKYSLKYINFIYRFHLNDVKIIVKDNLELNQLHFKAYPQNLDFFKGKALNYTTFKNSLTLEEDFLSISIRNQLEKKQEITKKVASLFEHGIDTSFYPEANIPASVIQVDFKNKKRID